MTWWLWVVAAIVVVLALLVARGMWLIGSGSDADLEARDRVDPGSLQSQGFHLLDRLRTGYVPLLSTVEKMLKSDDER